MLTNSSATRTPSRLNLCFRLQDNKRLPIRVERYCSARKLHVCCSSVFEQANSILTTATIGASAVGIFVSYMTCYFTPDPDDNTSDFGWGISGFITFLPLFNWLAWILPALQSNRSLVYYTYAAVYAYPLLRNGFDQDWYSTLMFAACIVHLQVERLARTEPEVLQNAAPLKGVGSGLAKALKAVGAFSGELVSTVRKDVRRIRDGKSVKEFERQLSKDLDESRQASGRQLKKFDEKLKKKNSKK